MSFYKKRAETYLGHSLVERGQDWKLIYSELSRAEKIETCIRRYSDTTLQLMFTYLIDPTERGNYAIKCAVRNKRCNLVKILLGNKNVDPSVDDNFCLQYSIINGCTKITNFLLKDPRVDPSVNSHYLLYHAIKSGYSDIVRYLVFDYRMTKANYTKAREFAGENKTILEILPEQDKLRYEKQPTESHIVYAIRMSDTRLLQYLLHVNSEDPSIKDDYALRYACDLGNIEIVKILLNDPRVSPNSFNNEAIKIASKRGHVAVVNALIDHDKFIDFF